MSCFANCIGRKKNKVYWANLNNSNGKKTWIDANGTQIFTLSQLCCVCVCVCGGGGGGGGGRGLMVSAGAPSGGGVGVGCVRRLRWLVWEGELGRERRAVRGGFGG